MRYLLLFLLCVLIGCDEREENQRIEIQRVFLHDVGVYGDAEYSVMYLENSKVKVFRIDNAEVFADAPAGEPMWMIADVVEDSHNKRFSDVKIHIHSTSDVNGGSWERGKAGDGVTVEVE